MDEARAILDQLMGKTRDFTENQKVTMHQIHFYDDQVCKYYICGLCPYIAFGGTKSDMGKCSSAVCGDIDADSCRDEWNKLPQEEKDKYGYERKTLLCLENIVKQCDRKIERQKQRAEQDSEVSAEDLKRLVVIRKQISEFTDQCELAADKGEIDDAMAMAKQIEQLKEAARKIVNPPDEKKITVCEVSGNFMSSRDNDERMRAHFEGKQFIGWKMVRDKYAELLRQNPPEASGAPPHKSSRRERDRGRDRDRGGMDREPGDRNGRGGVRKYDSRGGRSRDRSRDKDRDRSGDKGKFRDRSRDRSWDRSKNRDRSRDRDRGSGVSGERDRERSGSRGHGKEEGQYQYSEGRGERRRDREEREGSGFIPGSGTVNVSDPSKGGSSSRDNIDPSQEKDGNYDDDADELDRNGFFIKTKLSSSSSNHRRNKKVEKGFVQSSVAYKRSRSPAGYGGSNVFTASGSGHGSSAEEGKMKRHRSRSGSDDGSGSARRGWQAVRNESSSSANSEEPSREKYAQKSSLYTKRVVARPVQMDDDVEEGEEVEE